jgi:hypothetical protein
MSRPREETLDGFIHDAVRRLTQGVSEKFVPEPSHRQVLGDVLVGLGRFKTAVRWRYFWLMRDQEGAAYQSDGGGDGEGEGEAATTVSTKDTGVAGLGTGLKPRMGKAGPLGSVEVEAFLKAVDREVLGNLSKEPREGRGGGFIANEIKLLEQTLERSSLVVVPTDKTNSFKAIPLQDYIRLMESHIASAAIEVPRGRLLEIHLEAEQLLQDLQVDSFLGKQERRFLVDTLSGKAIPSPSLLIKDHKAVQADGSFPTRLVVPADNFTSGFPKLGYKGIKNIFDAHQVKYSRRNIINAEDLKGRLEELRLVQGEATIASLDVVNMYPSVRFKLIAKAVAYFSRRLPRKQRARVQRCLDLIKFGMGHSLFCFQGRYFEYNGEVAEQERGLTIGGFESAWLADLVAAFILEVLDNRFRRCCSYAGIYRDDGFLVFKGQRSFSDLERWLIGFQAAVDLLVEGDYFKFTMVMWDPAGNAVTARNGLSVSTAEQFPYLDMELFWAASGDLLFQVHLKENQLLKYLNRGSTHSKAVFKAIPYGVLGRLARLTSVTEGTRNLPLDQLYPHHAAALRRAAIAPDHYPTLQGMLQQIQSTSDLRKQRQASWKRKVFFCLGVSGWHQIPVHVIVKRLRNQFDMKWLRFSMSYHRFANLRQMYQRDREKKLMARIFCGDCMDRGCNCGDVSLVGGECPFGGDCRKRFVVYEASCQACSASYVGNTQQTVKQRFRQHCQDTKSLLRGRLVSADTFASHFARHIREVPPPSSLGGVDTITPLSEVFQASAGDIRPYFRVKVRWQGNPFAVMKTFRTYSCMLCVNEKVEILRASWARPGLLMNSRIRWDVACPHSPHFHRFNVCTSTDEDINPERVGRPTRV